MMRPSSIVVVLLLVIVGCRDPNTLDLVPVRGSVTQNGQPLSGALVEFVPVGEATGSGGSGRTDADGRYQLQTLHGQRGIPTGEYKVVIVKLVMPDGSDFPADSDVAPIDSAARQVLRPQYSELQQTVLKASITGPASDEDFDLE